jgi:dTDP-4-dehydrorhamnose reductase
MKFLIVGSEGQLGKALQKKLFSLSIPFYNFSRKGLNIEDSSQIHSLLSDLEFDLIINCAAYTSVDEAERNHRAAFQANEIGPKNLAVFCNNQSKKLIHISTDFVFDGSKILRMYLKMQLTQLMYTVPQNLQAKSISLIAVPSI